MNTPYIKIDTSRCTACWKCYALCKHNVLGKVNLPFHKHIKIINPDNCTGCFLCVKHCETESIKKILKDG